MGPLIPLFSTSGDFSSGFQRQSGQPYSHFGRGINDILNGPKSIPFKAGTVQYLKSVSRETLTSEHRLVSSPELHGCRQPVVVST